MRLLAFVMLGMVTIGVTMLWDLRNEVRRESLVASRNVVQTEAAGIDRELRIYAAALDAAGTASTDPAVLDAPEPLRHRALFDRIDDPATLGPIRIVAPDGAVIADSSQLVPTIETNAERLALAAHRDGHAPTVAFGRPVWSEAGGFGIEMSRRITLPDGGFGGIACGLIRLGALSERFRQLQIGRHDVVSLFFADGTMLAHAPGDPLVGRSIAGSDVLRRFAANRTGSFPAPGVLDGISRQFTFTHVGNWPLILDIGVSLSDLFASWRDKAVTVGLLLAAMAASGATLLLMLRREIGLRLSAEAVLSRSEARYRALTHSASDLIMRFGANGVSSYVSPSIRSFGYLPEELVDRDARYWVHAEDLARFDTALAAALGRQAGISAGYRMRRKNGSWCWVEARFDPLDDGGVMAALRDMDERKATEAAAEATRQELARLTTTDPLTGLGNRRALDEGLEDALRRAEREDSEITVLVADVDRFKSFNDHYGHLAGDEALRAVAQAISCAARRPDDLSVRFGGEEFAVVLPNTDIFGGITVAQTIRELVAELSIPHAESPTGRVSISIGVSSLRPSLHDTSAATVMERADEALYTAKRSGRDRVFALERLSATAIRVRG